MSKEETEGMVDPKEYSEKEQKQPDSNYRLWKLLEEIRDAIKANTTAMNNLCSAAFMNRTNVSFSNVPEQPERPLPEKPEPHPLIPQKQAEPLPKKSTDDPIVKVQAMFEASIANLLDFKIDGSAIIVKPRQFLGSDNFAKIAATIRQAGGEYVSAGKGSHFKVPVQ